MMCSVIGSPEPLGGNVTRVRRYRYGRKFRQPTRASIVVLAIPQLQGDLHLSAVGAQWIVNGYLAATFAVGRIADIFGHRRVLLIGVTGFAVCSALCAATPTGAVAETWMIVFRVLQGVSAALLFPAAMAIVAAAA
jgi:MFS family permease